ncbi:hypothetical protein C0Q70_16269 [Pomacea canaliculata]|uniref:Uncharacterized protein n=1 Tax=Pomacea canaliculata TaxID=400727 RepID=A0A2T7NPB3_POMCA|nr:hypothetical protein C0Q70_16269 [Pomacea canaliculata]
MRGRQVTSQRIEKKPSEVVMIIQARMPGGRHQVISSSDHQVILTGGSDLPFGECQRKADRYTNSVKKNLYRGPQCSVLTPKNDRRGSTASSGSRDPLTSCTYRLEAFPRPPKHVTWRDEESGEGLVTVLA